MKWARRLILRAVDDVVVVVGTVEFCLVGVVVVLAGGMVVVEVVELRGVSVVAVS